MSIQELKIELSNRLMDYRSEFAVSDDPEVIEGSRMIASTVDSFLYALGQNDLQKARLARFAISRQVSDAYYRHPKKLKDVLETMEEIGRMIRPRR